MQPVRILTPSFQFLGEIDDYESLQFTRRFRKPGEIELHINLNKNLTETLVEDNWVFLTSKKVGVIRHREIDRDNTEQLMVKGYTLKGLLSRRLTVPPFGEAYDKARGNVESVLKHYVRQNAVSPIDPSRVIPNLVITDDLFQGPVIEWQSRYKNLVDELETVSFTYGFGWDVSLDLENERLVFEVYEPRNLTTSQNELPPVIFSIDFDNVKSQVFTDSAVDYKNTAYVGGQGEGIERSFVELGNSTGLDRHETFIDARDVEDDSILPVRGQQKLQEMQKITSFETEILTYGPFVYEQDWDLGDIVTVQDTKLGITMDTPIPEVKEIYEPSGFRLDATFGNTVPTLIDMIKKVVDVPMTEKAYIPTKTSELENDAGYITNDEIPQAQTYVHDQIAPASTWTILHNLNKMPSVTVIDSGGNEVIGDRKYDSMNKVTLTFTTAFAGKALLN
nr:siphovirus ReqiPepy6 Gp37-like family protein [Fredinandcohnia onubensis]